MPVVSSSVRTSDPDAANAAMNAVYAPERPIVYTGSAANLSFAMDTWQLGDINVGRLRHVMRTHAVTSPFDEFITTTFLDGGMRWDVGGEQVDHRRGSVGRYPTGAGLTGEWDAFAFALLRVPMDVVRRLAHAHTGAAPSAFTFHGPAPLSPEAADQWRHLQGHVHRTLERGGAVLDSPLVQRTMLDHIAATALAVFPSTLTATPHVPGPGWVGPATLRRAVAYIEAHAREPISLADITAAAGTTGRALQHSFRRHHGTTPLGYLRRVRLEGTHRDLQAGDPAAGTTVAGTAAAWGFGQAGRFSQHYRQQYGVTPADTLRT